MKSRMAITAALVLGLLLSTTAVSFATSGLAGTGSDAATAQYRGEQPTVTTRPPATTTTTQPPAAAVQQAPAVAQVLQPAAPTVTTVAPTPVAQTPTVLDEQDEQGAPPVPAAGQPKVAPAPQVQPVQAPRQVVAAQTGQELPFTGFAAIPVLLGGLALLATGAVLRRRTGSQG